MNAETSSLKVFIPPEDYHDRRFKKSGFIDIWNSNPFLFEPERFTITQNIKEAECIGVLRDCDKYRDQIDLILEYPNIKVVFMLDLFHIYERSYHNVITSEWVFSMESILKEKDIAFFYLHTNLTGTYGIFYDYLFERQKRAFQPSFDIESFYGTVFFDYTTKDMFSLSNLKKKTPLKKFLSPNRIYPDSFDDRTNRRRELVRYLREKDGFVSFTEEGIVLPGQIPEPQQTPLPFGGFSPVHNDIYDRSFVSFYVETLTYLYDSPSGHMRSITEKTWNPLVKGHFILPYGYPGIVKDIMSYGVLLPRWIDYSYDMEEDNDTRFKLYLISVSKVLDLTVEDLSYLYRENFELILHNRNLILQDTLKGFYTKTVGEIA